MNRVLVAFAFCCVVMLVVIVCPVQSLDGKVAGKTAPTNLREWESLRQAGEANLNRAADCFPGSDCQYTVLLDSAASNYLEMAGMLTGQQRTAANVATVADGLLRSGRVADAIQLLRQQNDLLVDGNVQHLLADSLFSIGDYRNAALAYRTWISQGCGGYYSSLRDTGLWIVKKGLSKCSTLPTDLRTRLENLQELAHGEPSNLPRENSPAGRFMAR